MDESNLRDLNRKHNQVKTCKAETEPFGDFDPQKELIIEDPHYGKDSDFETLCQQRVRCCRTFPEVSWLWPAFLQRGPALRPGSKGNNAPPLRGCAVSSVDLLFLIFKKLL